MRIHPLLDLPRTIYRINWCIYPWDKDEMNLSEALLTDFCLLCSPHELYHFSTKHLWLTICCSLLGSGSLSSPPHISHPQNWVVCLPRFGCTWFHTCVCRCTILWNLRSCKPKVWFVRKELLFLWKTSCMIWKSLIKWVDKKKITVELDIRPF